MKHILHKALCTVLRRLNVIYSPSEIDRKPALWERFDAAEQAWRDPFARERHDLAEHAADFWEEAWHATDGELARARRKVARLERKIDRRRRRDLVRAFDGGGYADPLSPDYVRARGSVRRPGDWDVMSHLRERAPLPDSPHAPASVQARSMSR